jgi:hypothetical protein
MASELNPNGVALTPGQDRKGLTLPPFALALSEPA